MKLPQLTTWQRGEKHGNMDKKIPQSWKISSDSVWTSGSFLMSAFCLFVCLPVCLCGCSFAHLSVWMSVFLCVCLSAYMYLCLSASLSVCLFVAQPVWTKSLKQIRVQETLSYGRSHWCLQLNEGHLFFSGLYPYSRKVAEPEFSKNCTKPMKSY